MTAGAMLDRPASGVVAEDTIFAIASGAGRAAVAVMRLSGPRSGPALAALCGRLPPPRRAALRAIRAADGEALDHGLVLWLPGPRTHTGEDCAELHLHGSPAVYAAVAEALVALGARPAAAGEFSRRAFLNGRMDLLEAEAVADLVEADTAAQRRQALRQMEGALGELYRGWSERLRALLADQEALIDFPDEDLPEAVDRHLLREVAALRAEIAAHLDDGGRGERLRDGLVIAVTGPPNVGKSSLINALAGRDVAIVSPVPGTTRDPVEARLDLDGIPVTLVDTAGLRDTDDPVEAEGVRRARARAGAADLVLAVSEPGMGPAEDALGDGVPGDGAAGRLAVVNKIDLALPPPGALGVSARTGAGLAVLREHLAAAARELLAAAGPPPLTRARHRAELTDAAAALAELPDAALPELRAEHLRQAMRHLGRITGAVDVEDILDSIFSRFCIGK